MAYHYSMEIAALVFMLIFLFDFLYKKQFPRSTTSVFLPFVLMSIACSVLGVLDSIFLNHAHNYTVEFLTVLNIFYYFSQGICYFLFFLFCSAISGKVYRRGWVEPVFYWFPCIIYCFLAITTPFTGFFFYFTQSGAFRPTYGEPAACVLLSIYVLIHSYHLLRYGDKSKGYARITILSFCLITLCCSIIETIFPTLLLSGFARAISIAFMYITLQNPNELLDMNTGLFNKTAFYMSVEAKCRNNERYTIIYLNLDKFRFINNTFGYTNATALIVDISNSLKEMCDTNHIYRLDNDGFALLAKGYEELNFISAIRERFEQPWFIAGSAVLLSSKVVILRYPEHFVDPSELAHLLVYMNQLAKEQGEGSLSIATANDIDAYRRQLQIEDAVKEAIRNHTVRAYYQPIHSAKSGKLHAAEVLSRISDAKLGNIPPQEFIEIAEKNGYIVDLGYRIFEETCQFIQSITTDGTLPNLKYIEVNISAVQCMQPDLADRLIEIAEMYAIEPSYINFEITETAAIQSDVLLHKHMAKLHARGFTFSLDDYGTGFANCSYLIMYPFDQIKFDRSMTLAFFSDDAARLIMANEFDTMQKLGKTIVAEGVETREQAEALAKQGVDFIQGHYYSEPLSADAFKKYILE